MLENSPKLMICHLSWRKSLKICNETNKNVFTAFIYYFFNLKYINSINKIKLQYHQFFKILKLIGLLNLTHLIKAQRFSQSCFNVTMHWKVQLIHLKGLLWIKPYWCKFLSIKSVVKLIKCLKSFIFFLILNKDSDLLLWLSFNFL